MIAAEAWHYVLYLMIVALAGCFLARYDLNLLALALPLIAHDLNISATGLGVFGFFAFCTQFVIMLFTGAAMDRLGPWRVWMFCLAETTIFTGCGCWGPGSGLSLPSGRSDWTWPAPNQPCR